MEERKAPTISHEYRPSTNRPVGLRSDRCEYLSAALGRSRRRLASEQLKPSSDRRLTHLIEHFPDLIQQDDEAVQLIVANAAGTRLAAFSANEHDYRFSPAGGSFGQTLA